MTTAGAAELEGDAPGETDGEVQDTTFFTHSTYREKLIEHVFIAELLQEAWVKHRCVIEVLRAEIDASGFDVVLACGPFTRHIQLKATKADGGGKKQGINTKLSEKPSGCVVWMIVDEDPVAGKMQLTYRYFGGLPGHPLPSLSSYPVAKRTTRNKKGERPERPGIRDVPAAAFVRLVGGPDGLLKRLFGDDYAANGLLALAP